MFTVSRAAYARSIRFIHFVYVLQSILSVRRAGLAQVTLALWLALGTVASSASPRELPLANTYHRGLDLSAYWVSEKYDGVRAYWDGERLWSRGGHPFRAPPEFTEGFPAQPLDGELWLGRGRFAELSGIVRTVEPASADWQQVRYMVFDLPVTGVPFTERYRRLKALVAAAGSRHLKLVEQAPVASHEALMRRMHEVVSAGGEGVMLKRKASLYQGGRSDDLVKVKPYEDAEAVVVRVLPGQGKYEGQMGSLLVALPNGRRFRIGTGFSDAERAQPPRPGQTVTFRFRGHTATGLPRFASFLRVRNDEPPGDPGELDRGKASARTPKDGYGMTES